MRARNFKLEPETMVGVGIFLILAVVAGILGFGGAANLGEGIARALFFVFLVLLVVSVMAMGFTREIREGYKAPGR